MIEKIQESKIGEKRVVIEAFLRGVDQASFVLKENPELIFPQVYNRLQWRAEEKKVLKKKLKTERTNYKRPWLRLINQSILQSSALIRTYTGPNIGEKCAFHPNGNVIVTCSFFNKILKLWDLESGKELITIKGHEYSINDCNFSPDGKRIISGGGIINFDAKIYHGELKLWNTENGEEIDIFKDCITGVVNACAFSPNGKKIISASDDHTLKLWDIELKKEIATLKGHTYGVDACAISLDGKKIISSDGITLKLWDLLSVEEPPFITHHLGSVSACTFSPDVRKIVSSNGLHDSLKPENSFGDITIWNGETGKEITTIKLHNDRVETCKLSPNGKKIVTASRDKTVKLWDMEKGEEIALLKGHFQSVKTCAFSPCGRYILSGSDDGTLKLWNTENGKELYTLEHTMPLIKYKYSLGYKERAKGTIGVIACNFTPDSRRIISAADNDTLKIWNAKKGKELVILRHGYKVTTFDICNDGKKIVSSSSDHTLKVWDGETGKALAILEGHSLQVNTCAFSPDGKCIISASDDRTLKLWDAESGEEITTLKGHTDQATFCAFSPDSRLIISASQDKTLKMWDIRTGVELTTFKGFTSKLTDCSFSPDSTKIVVGDSEGQVLLLDLENIKVYPVIVTPYRESEKLYYCCQYCRETNQIEDFTLGQEVVCLACGKKLKLNPFAVERPEIKFKHKPWWKFC